MHMLAAGVALCTQVGLWDIDHTSAGDDSSTYDGVLLFEPHRDYVSSLKWLGPSGSALLTGSYDGIVRQLDVETGVCVCACGGQGGSGEEGAAAHCAGVARTPWRALGCKHSATVTTPTFSTSCPPPCCCCCMCAGVWGIVGGVPHDLDECNWSAGDATPDGSTVFLATSAGQFSLMDTRTANSSSAAPHLTIANRSALNSGVC